MRKTAISVVLSYLIGKIEMEKKKQETCRIVETHKWIQLEPGIGFKFSHSVAPFVRICDNCGKIEMGEDWRVIGETKTIELVASKQSNPDLARILGIKHA